MWPRSRGRHPSRRGNPRHRGGPSSGYRGGNPRGMSRGGYYDKPSRPYGKSHGSPKRYDRPPVYKQPAVIERLNEVDIGITQYINSLEGFNGILKARYSDFQVNEIDKDGKIAKLTDLSIPVDPEPEPVEEDDEGVVNRYRIEQLPIETWDKMHKMVQSTNKSESVEIDVTNTTKGDRTKIHEAVKTVFGAKIVGSTISKEDKKLIIFKKFNKHDKVDLREKWPSTRAGEFVHFLVHKEFTDTIEANIQISDCLQMRTSSFCYAGVKDRRAKTTQWFCVRKVDPSKIVERTKNLKNIYVGNFCYKKETLKLGQLKGNRFRIAVREIMADTEIIEKALESLKDNGFINYYGLQRFGNSKEVPTHTIGVELLRGNWAEAVSLILKPRKYEQLHDVAAAKLTYLETGDAAKAFAKLKKNRNKCIEGKLFGGLVKHDPKDLVNALENVPRNMRLLYIHAYQSLVWNIMTSRRIEEFGLKPIVGDIIVDDEQGTDALWESVETDLTDKYEPDHESHKEVKVQQIKVKILTESDLPKYTIYDVVLPLPGYDITYPDNLVKEWYKEYLEKDGLSLDMPKQKVKTYTLSGAYRKIVERVTELSWKFMEYNDPVASLIRSDIEELKGKAEPKNLPSGKYKALIVDFCLSSSCYATMALRELMKINTSWDGTKGTTKKADEKEAVTEKKDTSDNEKNTIKNKEIKTENSAENNTSEKYEPEAPTSENDSVKSEPEISKKESNNDSSSKSENTSDVKEVKMEEEKPAVIKVETEEPVEKIHVITQEEIQIAKKEFIKKEIAELEDEIWSVMEDDSKSLSGSKRKSENPETTVDAKKIKSDKETALADLI